MMDWSKIAVACLAITAPCLALADDAAKATAEFQGCADTKVTGSATLKEQVTAEGVKEVTVEMTVKGLKDGQHAVHIHEVGQCQPCAAAGGHHDPGPNGQARPDSAADATPATDINHPFHMGDLINLEVKDGVGKLKHTTNRVTLGPGRLSVFDTDGSSIIVHTQPDTYCDQESELKKGCAGGTREACAVLKPVR
jgi:Cu-Zn family superoxide dismutase